MEEMSCWKVLSESTVYTCINNIFLKVSLCSCVAQVGAKLSILLTQPLECEITGMHHHTHLEIYIFLKHISAHTDYVLME